MTAPTVETIHATITAAIERYNALRQNPATTRIELSLALADISSANHLLNVHAEREALSR